jgi:hypothetical protein
VLTNGNGKVNGEHHTDNNEEGELELELEEGERGDEASEPSGDQYSKQDEAQQDPGHEGPAVPGPSLPPGLPSSKGKVEMAYL